LTEEFGSSVGVGRVSVIRLIRIVAKATCTPWDVVWEKIHWVLFLGILADISREAKEQEEAMKAEQARAKFRGNR
jgi:hypothetical protein